MQDELAGDLDQVPGLGRRFWFEVTVLVTLFFIYAGDPAPMVNEAHYLVKAKNYWQPTWCDQDLFVSSAKVHTTFYFLFGWLTKYVSLNATAWVGRVIGWVLLAVGLQRLCFHLGLRAYACLAVATTWIVGIEYGNLAGEWVVGGIEAKVPAYGLVLLGLAQLVQRRWQWVWPLLGGAAAFHVLTGGWSVVAAMIVWWWTERGRENRIALLTPSLFVGGAIALFGLVPALMLGQGASAEDARVAARIYAYFRIRHHLLPADFQVWWYIRHGMLIASLVLLFRWYPQREQGWWQMRWFATGSLAIAGAGLLVGILPTFTPDLAAKLLRFYWFRLSDAVIPLTLALFLARCICDSAIHRRNLGMAILCGVTVLMVISCYEKHRLNLPPSVSAKYLGIDSEASPQQQQQVYRDWVAVCDWVRLSSSPEEVWLTPRHQQSFKWYANRAEVVNWKDVPQDAKTLRLWYDRFREVYPPRLGTRRVTIRYSDLRQLTAKYGVRRMIVDRRVTGNNLPLIKLYPTGHEVNQTYAVYELPINAK